MCNEYDWSAVNRPKGSNYVVSAHSVGGSTLFNVKYEEVWVNVLHNNIPMNYITVLSVGHEFNKYSLWLYKRCT